VLLEDKVAIVTGAGSGIGAASALRFATEGAAVVVADIRLHKARETVDAIAAAGGQALAVETDVADAGSVAALVDTAVDAFGGLDVLFNNAGTLRPGTAVELSVEDWDLVMAVNVRSVFLGAKYAVPVMEARGGGSIINTASVSGLHGDGGSVVYSASKAAVINLTRALSTDHARSGIRVNAICPGAIETPPVQRMMQHPGARELNERVHALGRIGRPDEIAAAAVWLASDESSFVTGEALVVDGGLRAQSPMGRLVDPRPEHKR
jgi:NAD(P)-dependent dehydrogenase (short-subunit alcohol dehydrogenase family)